MPGNTPASIPIRPEHESNKTVVTSMHNPTSASSSDKPTSSNDTSGTGPTPAVSADPSSTQKQQGADRPTEEHTGGGEHDRNTATKKEAGDAAKVDISGPGPKPLSEVKRDGGAGAGGDDDGSQKEGHGEGTGAKHVKSSGVKANGGDFDAANPGAGEEANREFSEEIFFSFLERNALLMYRINRSSRDTGCSSRGSRLDRHKQ
jgi:hypothetical protein